MAPQQGPAGPRRRLGAELRRLRLNADMTLDEVAERMTCSTSKISRLETGKGIPKLPDVNELIRIYGVTSDAEQDMLRRLVREGRTQGWWEPYVEGVPPERFVMDAPARYPSLETAARAVSSFDLAVIHGLLQTEDYARAVLNAILPHHRRPEIDKLVRLRRMRQLAVVERDPPLSLSVVLDEAALNRVVGGAAVMSAELDFVVERSSMPNVDVRVLRFGAGAHRAHAGDFVLLEFPDSTMDCVYIEGHAGDQYLEGESDVELYKGVFADVADRALDPDESRELISWYARKHAPRRKATS
jgi:transcriptional regulator with XRE-family HTH domain